jgi:hypothetical protein
MMGLVVMFGHMSIGAVVAAEGSAAGLTGAEVDPVVAGLDTFFTSVFGGGLEGREFLDM